jgi:hypothetical protein
VTIAYHDIQSPFNNSDACIRDTYYGMPGTPDVRIDGTTDEDGGIPGGNMYPYYRPDFDTRKSIAPQIEISQSVVYDTTARQGTVTIMLNNPSVSAVSGQLQVALAERSVPYSWQGLDSEWSVERKMLPNAYGEAVTLGPGSDTILTDSFKVNSAWNQHNCDLIAFVQDNSSKAILQGSQAAVMPAPGIGFRKYDPVTLVPGIDTTLRVYLRNTGTADAQNVAAVLTTADSFITITSESATYGAVPRLTDAAPQADFRIHVSDSCPDPHLATINLAITADSYTTTASFPLNITATPGFTDGMENGTNGWTHSGLNDDWHITQHRSHWGTHSWYSGAEGSWQYTNDNDARLVTPFFTMGDSDRLAFYQWYAFASYYDCGYVDISNGSDFWWPLATYTGSSGDWQLTELPVSQWSGQTVQVRFRFYSDYEYTAEGWYIDDFAGGSDLGVADHPRSAASNWKLAMDQNPVSRHMFVSYAVPVGKTATLVLFDVNGRKVATLGEGLQGQGRVQWNVPDAIVNGMYFAGLRSGTNLITTRITVVK